MYIIYIIFLAVIWFYVGYTWAKVKQEKKDIKIY